MDSSSSSVSVQQKHEVFLSFRGEDTRYNFTSHLYAALKRKSIDAFIDNELKRGDEISSALLKVIEESKISIIILSKNYASSSWCLDELSKIVECKNTNGQMIIPIFYHVDPSDVRKQKGNFEQAFAEHERFKERKDKVQRWKDAMKEVANLCGWHLEAQQKDRSESELIDEIVDDILEKLIYKSSNDSKGLIGIDSHIQQIESLLSNKLVDVCIIGIWGMGGVGKTTIAEAIFNQIFTEFEGYCFLANIREESEKYGCVRLQEKLVSKIFKDRTLTLGTSSLPTFIIERLRCRKVLIVLDDIYDSTQLDLLPRKCFFGPGSRIILTSRDKQVLQQVADEVYEVKGLIDHQALQLFSLNAFKQDHPREDYVEISKRVVNYAEGIPLALKVLGSALYGKSKLYWESSLKKPKKIANPKVHNLLTISYEGLDDEVKGIFLDIACFFKGEDRDYVTTILDGCYYAIYSGISDLVDKSLVTISNNKLWVHDLLQEMGWNIVRGKSIKEPGKWSRLWNPDDVYHVLKNNNMGTAAIEGIFLDMSKIKELHLSPSVFMRMYNLRLLKLYYSDFQRDNKVNLSQKALKCLPDKLCYLHWDGYPSKSLPSNFCPEKLVELNMPRSNADRLWDGVQNLVKLKQIDLSFSKHLIRIPDLSRAKNLETMKLSGCISLVEVPSSIRYMKKLRILSLSGCSNITECPEISGNLEELQLNGTAIEQVPSSIGFLSRLRYLDLSNCKRLESLPSSICKLKFLENLDLYGCSKLESFPDILESMKSLKEFCLKGTGIEELPSSIEHLVGLTTLELDNCKRLKNLPGSISKLKSLQVFSLSGCSNITQFPEISGNLMELSLDGTAIKQVPSSIECLSALNRLNLMNCTELECLPSSIYRLNLEYLYLSGCSKLKSLPETLDSRESLEELDLKGKTIQELPSTTEHLSGLVALDLRNSNKFLRLGNTIGKMTSLKYLFVSGCLEVEELLDNLENLDSLEHLCLSDCNLLEFPSCLTCIFSLKKLELSRNNFGSIPASIKRLSELERLDLSHCKRLQSLPDLPPRLDYLNAHDCTSLAAVSSLFSTILNWSDEFVFSNCLKLDQNALGQIMAQAQPRILHRATEDVKHYYEPAHGNEYRSFFTICFPGSKIPEWFSFQHTGSSITILLPQHLRDNRFVGFALCVVVAPEDFDDDNSGFKVACQCKFKTNNNECRDCICYLSDRVESKFIGSDHVFLAYDFNLYLEWETKYDFIEASFEFYPSDSGLFIPVDCYKVKKCGVCLLYAQDDPTESPTQLSLGCGVINQDFGEPMLEDGTTIKRCHSDFCYEEAGPSRNFSLDEEEPQPKRLKLFQRCQQPTQD